MQNIRDMKLLGIFCLEFFQRGQRIVLTRLHFDGRDVVAVADLTLGDQKSYSGKKDVAVQTGKNHSRFGIYLSTNVDESGIIHAEKPNSMQQIREAR